MTSTERAPLTLRAAVNVDVDGLYLYDRIHGHSGTAGSTVAAGNSPGFDPASHDAKVFVRGVPRFLDLFARAGVKATFFVVAQDLAHPEVRAVLADVVKAGHEVGSHSLTHPYNLSRLHGEALRQEVTQARQRLQDASGQAVVGFRAPGYVLSAALLQAVADAGHVYDSSRFPCPPYQLAKVGVIGLYRALGRPSASIPEAPAVWLGKRTPYIEHLPSGQALLELPIGVLPGLRLPLIGTAVVAGGEALRLAWSPLLARTDWLNLECHGIDLLDFAGDDVPARLAKQPDQRVPLREKWPVLLKTVEQLARTHEVRTLAAWAESAERV